MGTFSDSERPLRGHHAYEAGVRAGEEAQRERIAAWLRAIAMGRASQQQDPRELRELATLIERGHADRWAAAVHTQGDAHTRRGEA